MIYYIIRTKGPVEWELYTPPGTSDLRQRLVPETNRRALGSGNKRGPFKGEVHYWTGSTLSHGENTAYRFKNRKYAEARAFQIVTMLMPSLMGELEVHERVGHKVQASPST